MHDTLTRHVKWHSGVSEVLVFFIFGFSDKGSSGRHSGDQNQGHWVLSIMHTYSDSYLLNVWTYFKTFTGRAV